MAKVSRLVLKEIVKECLLEILFEGIDSEPGYEEETIREARRPRASRPPSKRDLAAAVQQQTQSKRKKRELNRSTVQQAAAELTDNPMMTGIFEDTAMTTLQEQNQASGRRPPADNAAAAVDSAEDIGDLFEGAGNWASIAFGETE